MVFQGVSGVELQQVASPSRDWCITSWNAQSPEDDEKRSGKIQSAQLQGRSVHHACSIWPLPQNKQKPGLQSCFCLKTPLLIAKVSSFPPYF